MAWCSAPLPFPSSIRLPESGSSFTMKFTQKTRRKTKEIPTLSIVNVVKNDSSEGSTKLVTFLGKGGSGKTTAAIFAAQHYANLGFKTCLVIHTQDPTPEYLLNRKIGPTFTECNDNLSAIRLETTKMILEPLKRIKQADARLNMTQGVLEGVVGEELGILPGMDSVFSALELNHLIGFFGNAAQRNKEKRKFDIVIYDGISTEETIRLLGATSKARLYLRYLRSLSEKTDMGRVAGPSLLRLVDEALSLSGRGADLNGRTSSETWDYIDKMLEKGSSLFSQPQKFSCYVIMDPTNPLSVSSALRYWGQAIQAGARISGAFGTYPPNDDPTALDGSAYGNFSPLPCAFIPRIKFSDHLNWNEVMASDDGKDARSLLSETATNLSSVTFDTSGKSVTLFMPGFDKSEIKLFQFRGGSELLVEAGDQRRVICLPSAIQGKVGGAKFVDRNLIIKMR